MPEEPTKQQTVAFFAHEKAQKANKVSSESTGGSVDRRNVIKLILSLPLSLLLPEPSTARPADVLRLPCQEPYLGVGAVWSLHLPRLFECA